MCLVIILLAACSGLGATVSTASSAPDFVFVPTSGPCLTNNGGQPTVPYYNDIVVSKAVSMDPEPGEMHIPGHGPEVETIEACLAACLERNVHVVSVNFLQGRECMCSGGCPCFEPLGGGWLVALPANCQHQQPQVCQDSESNGGWEPRGNRSSCMGFFDKGGHPVDDTKMSHPWGKASFAHCHQPFSWRQMNKNMSKDVFKTGGLGTLMEMDGYETWVCLHSSIIRPHWNPRCPHTGLVATVDPWFCWVYHETREEFTPWGPNSRVKLFDPPPVKDPIRSPDGRFVLVDMPMTWEEARTYCRTHFADLVSIHSSLVNSIVASLCEKAASVNGAEHGDTGIACWIGGYRSMSSQGLDLWAWSDGSAFDFTSWSEGEPNNMGSHGEPYIHMWRGGERVGTWNDNGAGFEAGATVCSAVVEVAGSGYSYWDFDPVDGCVTESEMNARKALEDLDTQEWWPDFASMAGFAHAGGAADKCGGISEEDFKAFAAKYFSGGSGGECSLCADPTHNCRCSAEKGLSGVCGPAPFCYDAATTAMGGRTAQEQCVADSDIWCGPLFSTKSIHQSTPNPCELNTFTVTMVANVPFMNGQTIITISGLSNADFGPEVASAVGSTNTVINISDASGGAGHHRLFGSSFSGEAGTGHWDDVTDTLTLYVLQNTESASEYTFSFKLYNPPKDQPAVTPRISASFVGNSKKLFTADVKNDILATDMTYPVTEVQNLHDPLYVIAARFTEFDVSNTSVFPCDNNTITIGFKTNVPLWSRCRFFYVCERVCAEVSMLL